MSKTKNSYLTSYAKWILNIRMLEISDKYLRTEEVLLRRGFLVFLHYDEKTIYVREGSSDDDLSVLGEIASLANWSKTSRKLKHIIVAYNISNNPFSDKLIEYVILLPSCRGMSFCYNKMKTWDEFIKNKYGHKVPAKGLDLGVALFIKSLPFAGVRTKLSCDGHGIRPVHIEFPSKYFRDWFLFIMSSSMIESKNLKINKLKFKKVKDNSLEISLKFMREKNFEKELIEIANIFFSFAKAITNYEAISYFQEQKRIFISQLINKA